MEGSYSVSNIQVYIKYIIEKLEELPTNPPTHIYINRINNTLVFKVKKMDISLNYKDLKRYSTKNNLAA